MKNKLLQILLIITAGAVNAQILTTEDCTGLVIGNIGTDIAGTNAGQGGWFTRTLSPLNGNNNFQIADVGGVYGNAIKITGFSGANVATPTPETTNSRFLYKSIATEWANRDFGAEITEVEFDFFTGPATTSSNIMRVAIYDGQTNVSATKVLAGILIPMSTLTIRGVMHLDPTTIPNGTGAIGPYSVALGSNGAPTPVFSDITLNRDTWYRIGFSFNTSTGEVKFKGAGITRNSIIGAAASSIVDNITLIATTGGIAPAVNTSSAIGTFDNITVKASIEDTLLAIDKIETISSNNFLIAPNPVEAVINVTINNKVNVTELLVLDQNGRLLKSSKNQSIENINLNVQDLTAGMYFLKLKTDSGLFVQKFIKK